MSVAEARWGRFHSRLRLVPILTPGIPHAKNRQRGGRAGQRLRITVMVAIFLARALSPTQAGEACPIARYLRIVYEPTEPAGGWRWLCQTAVRRLELRDGTVLHLLSAMHLGTQNYFESLEPYLREADTVIVEGFCGRLVREPLIADSELPEELLWGRRLMRMMARHTGLITQISWDEGLNDSKRWILGDLTSGEMLDAYRLWKPAPVDATTKKMILWMETAAVSPDQALRDRARSYARSEALRKLRDMCAFDGIMGDRIDRERERRLLETVKAKLGDHKKRIAILWGAAHMPLIEADVTKMGFKYVGTTWHDACGFEVQGEPLPVPEGDRPSTPPR